MCHCKTEQKKKKEKNNNKKRSKLLIAVLDEVFKISVIIFQYYQRGSSV